MFTKIIVV